MTNAITIRDTASTSTTGQGGQVIFAGTPTAASVAAYSTEDEATAIDISGTWTGTLSFEQSPDGISFAACDAVLQGVNTVMKSCTGNGIFNVSNPAGYITRVRATAAMTGQANIAFTSSNVSNLQQVIVVNAPDITIGSFQGVDANGAAPTGKPVLVAGSDGAAVRTILTDATGRLLADKNVDTAALLTLTAAGASTVHSADQVNYSGKGINLVVDLTTMTTATVTVTIEGKDIASGKYYTILSSAALATTGTTLLSVFPGAPVAANVTANAQLPKTWRASAVIVGGSAAATGTIGASVV